MQIEGVWEQSVEEDIWTQERGSDGRTIGVRFPVGAGNFSLNHRIQNGSGAHPDSYPMGTTGSFPGGKAAGA
jgi:hypothetical protein